MPPGSLLKRHVFMLNFVGVSFWGWAWCGTFFLIFFNTILSRRWDGALCKM